MTQIKVSISVLGSSGRRGGYYGYQTAELEVDGDVETALRQVPELLTKARGKVTKNEKVLSERIMLKHSLEEQK